MKTPLLRYFDAIHSFTGKGSPDGVVMGRRDFIELERITMYRDERLRPVLRGIPFDWVKGLRSMLAVAKMPLTRRNS